METGRGRAAGGILGSVPRRHDLSRRRVLSGVAGLGLTGCAAAADPDAKDGSLRISTFGGFFERGFAAHIYPEFTRQTGIKVQSISQAEGLSFLMQLIQATKAGIAPLDLCLNSPLDVLRGRAAGIWRTFPTGAMGNIGNLPDTFISHGPSGVDAIGALGWYLTFVYDPTRLKTPPTSWSMLWEPGRRDAWGLNGGGTSYLWEIAAATWFGGPDIMRTPKGIETVGRKIAELAPNVKLWWDNEGVMQTAIENQDVLGGNYFNDVAKVLASDGTPVVSVFPREGGVIDFGSWCQPSASTKTREADIFIDFMCSPHAQQIVARDIEAAPLIRRDRMNLTSAEILAVSSDISPIHVDLALRSSHLEFLSSEFNRLVLA